MKSFFRFNGIVFIYALIAISCNRQEAVNVTLINPLTREKVDELVAIKLSDLERFSGAQWKTNSVLILNGTDTIPCQTDDLNGDGIWDEVAFLVNVKAKDSIQIILQPVSQKVKIHYPSRTNLRMAKIIELGKKYEELKEAKRIVGTDTKVTSTIYQMEGPGWENDVVAFRNYLDQRNGIDIFGKLTTDMVLDKAGINENYHLLQVWGMDILKVANSLGAGALSIFNADTLLRVASPCDGSFELLAEGPVRSIFNLYYKNWKVGDEVLHLTQQITIWGGLSGYESKVTIAGDPKGRILVPGLVRLHTDSLYTVDKSANTIIIATHDKQAFNGEYLGMALLLPKEQYLGSLRSPDAQADITATFGAKLKANDNSPVTYRFYCGWELSDSLYANKDYFLEELEQAASNMDNPLIIKW